MISPCGLQVAGRVDVIHNIAAVAEWRDGYCDSSNYREQSLLQEHVPVLAAFLIYCPFEDDGDLPQAVLDLVKLLLYLVQCLFKDVLPHQTCISHSTVDPLSFFLCLAKLALFPGPRPASRRL